MHVAAGVGLAQQEAGHRPQHAPRAGRPVRAGGGGDVLAGPLQLLLGDRVHLDADLHRERLRQRGHRPEVDVALVGEEAAEGVEALEDVAAAGGVVGVLHRDGVGLLPDVEEDLDDPPVDGDGPAAAGGDDRGVDLDHVGEPVAELLLARRPEHRPEVLGGHGAAPGRRQPDGGRLLGPRRAPGHEQAGGERRGEERRPGAGGVHSALSRRYPREMLNVPIDVSRRSAASAEMGSFENCVRRPPSVADDQTPRTPTER